MSKKREAVHHGIRGSCFLILSAKIRPAIEVRCQTVELLNRCGDVLPEVLTLPHLLVVTPFHVLHDLRETVTSRSPVHRVLGVADDVGADPPGELCGEPFCSECVRDTGLSKWQRLILLRCLIYQYAGVSELLAGLLTYRFSLSTPFSEPLCITLSASLFVCPLLVLLKLLTLKFQLITRQLKTLPLVIKALIRLINLPALNSQILLMLIKGALLILHRAVHFLRCSLIVTQRIDIGFNLPTLIKHPLFQARVIPAKLSLPTHLPTLVITNTTM